MGEDMSVHAPFAQGPYSDFLGSLLRDVGEGSQGCALLGPDELPGMPHASDSSSSDRLSADCEFLLSAVFDLDAALSSLPPPHGGCANHLLQPADARQAQPVSGCYSSEKSKQGTREHASAKSMPTSELRSFGSLFGPAFSTGTGGTPSIENRPPASHWHPSSLPPKAVKKNARSDRLTLNSSIKGAVARKQMKQSDRIIKPFCIVKSGLLSGGITLQDLNASILEMVTQAGACSVHQPLRPAPQLNLTAWQH